MLIGCVALRSEQADAFCRSSDRGDGRARLPGDAMPPAEKRPAQTPLILLQPSFLVKHESSKSRPILSPN